MPARSLIVAALCVVVLGVLAYRVVAIERRTEALREQLEGPAPAAAAAPGASVTHTAGADASQAQRLKALEEGVAEARTTLSRIKFVMTEGVTMPNPRTEQEILAVVQREDARVRNAQLEWSHTRWQAAREAQLDQFALHNALSGQQTAELKKSLTREVDAMVDVLRRPGLFEDPEKTAVDWQALLDETDQTAARVLNPAQLDVWKQVREFERKLLWPWLPKNAKP